MGDIRGFLKVRRKEQEFRPVCERVNDFCEVALVRKDKHSQEQASRCMDCGTPFCHWACPAGNYIPEWNDLVFRGHWQRALELLLACNNFPEFTGRLCPAICEYSCVLGLNPVRDRTPEASDGCLRQPVSKGVNDEAVTIRENELSIIEKAFKKGYIKPNPPKSRTGKKVALIGSGPSGLACCDQLNKAGHKVVLFERDDKIGGLLRYGIPDFKLEKRIIDRRLNILKKEGIEFKTGINVGVDFPVSKLLKDFDAVCLAGGSRVPRDLKIEGRKLNGIHFAMDYLIQSNKRVAGEILSPDVLIDAKDKRVVVIGGGDTGADCVGTAHRQGARRVIQIELLPKPPECRSEEYPWPKYPLLLKTSTSHEEGGKRYWSVLTKKFTGENGYVKKLHCVKVDFSKKDERGCPIMSEVRDSEFEIETDLVILAVGFLHPEHRGLLSSLNVEFDSRGNVKTDAQFMTSKKGVFCCGDMHRGQSLIVHAISEGRQAAHHIDAYLMEKSNLPLL